jgi:hypothetical protein
MERLTVCDSATATCDQDCALTEAADGSLTTNAMSKGRLRDRRFVTCT